MNLDKRVTGTTLLTGLIGNPVQHTVSPLLHNSLFNALGINGIYIPMKVPEDGLGDSVKGLKAVGFTGFNVTIPYKEQIIEYLDELSDEARMFGAVNTIKIKDGKLIGYNTDGYGFIRAFTEKTGTSFKNKNVCVLGAGGTARSLTLKIATEGAAKICIINRTASKAEELAECLSKIPEYENIAVYAASGTDEASTLLYNCDIIVNTTSMGMHPDISSSPIQQDIKFRKDQLVYDVIYNPSKTKLLLDAEAYGCKTVNGAGMLYYQGVRAFEIWMDKLIPKELSDNLLSEFLKYLNP